MEFFHDETGTGCALEAECGRFAFVYHHRVAMLSHSRDLGPGFPSRLQHVRMVVIGCHWPPVRYLSELVDFDT